MRHTDAYERMKDKMNKAGKTTDLSKKEEVYWIGATIPAMLFAGFIDGGVSVAIAYAARKLYEMNNG